MQVVLYDQNSIFHKTWSDQFVKNDPANRKRVGMDGRQTPAMLVNTIANAAKLAAGAELIFAVGHGGAEFSNRSPSRNTDPTALAQGLVDLAPNKKLRLGRGHANVFVDPFYDYVFHQQGLKPESEQDKDKSPVLNLSGASSRLHNWTLYQQIASAMKTNKVYRVVFLTCNIGNATNFIKKIALDWNVLVRAYTRYVWFVGNNPVRVCLDGDENAGPTNTPESAYRVPQVDFTTVGPPK